MHDYLEPVNDGLVMRESGIWVAKKLDYLKRYIEIFETSMRKKWGQRNFVDIFAGPGKCYDRKSGAIYLGSPLIALTTQFPFTDYFFVDNDYERIEALRTRRSATSSFGSSQFFNGDGNIAVNEVIEAIKQNDRKRKSDSLNLAFLDPDGLELHWNTVATLAKVPRMDLLIHYSVNGLKRNLKNATKVEQHALDLFFGDREWRTIYQQVGDESVAELELLKYYKSKLESLGYKVNQDAEGTEPPIRNTKGGLLYRLLFASKDPLGHKFWNEVIKRDVYGQRRIPGF